MRVGISQSNYIPWKGFIDLISSVDVFVLYDDMQYTKRDWRNRNLIKTPRGLEWLTVPVSVKGKYFQSIRETQIQEVDWVDKHLRTFEANYSKAPFYSETMEWLFPLFNSKFETISELNRTFLKAILEKLEVKTELLESSKFELVDGRTERLLAICNQLGASAYVSGPAAKDYFNHEIFSENQINVEWFDYSGYQKYPQLWGSFEEKVTVLDVFFNCGEDSKQFIIKGSK